METMQAVRTVGAGMLGIAIVVLVAATLFGFAFDLVGIGEETEEIEPVVGEDIVLDTQPDDQNDTSVGVAATRGNAVELDGSGFVDGAVPSGWPAGNWTFAAVAVPDEGAGGYGEGVTHVVFTDDDAGLFVAWDNGEWIATYHDGGESARVGVDATAGTTEIVVTHDSGELAIHADGATDAATLDNAGINEPDETYRWVGSIDEVRFVDGVLTDDQIATYQDDPVNPLAEANHDGRVMFNSDTPRVYHTDQTATLVDAGLTSGVAGPDLERGVDYELATDPLSVTVLEGSYLEGAPTAFATVVGGAASFVALLGTVASTGAAALGLLAIGLLILAARSVLDDFGGGF